MKKYLLGTSALVAAGFMAGQANAADKLSLGVGGFIEQWFGYTDKEEDRGVREWTNFNQMTDAEIHFKGTVNLDNGMKVTARVELETNADRQNVSIDEVWLQISSDSLGMIEIGEQDIVTDSMVKGFGGYGIGLGDADKWILDTPGIGGEDPESPKVTGSSQDQGKVNYYTPAAWQKATGLQAAISYVPDLTNNDSEANTNRLTEGHDAYALGLTYSQSLMGVDTYLFYGYYDERPAPGTNNNSASQSVQGHMVSANFQLGGWEFGGGYARAMEKTTATDTIDGYSYNLGLGYTMDRWKFSGEYMYITNAQTTTTNGDAERRVWMADAAYNLGGGITWKSSIFHQRINAEELTDAGIVNDGWGIVTGLVASF